MSDLFGAAVEGLFGLAGASAAESAAHQQADTNYERQKEFAQNGLQWRVQDAQKAGVHPLFGLNANTQGFSPNPISDPGWAELGRSTGHEVAAAFDTNERSRQRLALEQMKADKKKTEAETMLIENQIARNNMSAMQTKPWPMAEDYSPINKDAQQVEDVGYNDDVSGAIVRSHPGAAAGNYSSLSGQELDKDWSVSPGTSPSWSEWQIDPKLKLVLPYSGGQGQAMSESVEDIPKWWWPIIIKKNTERYGSGWKYAMARKFPGLAEIMGAKLNPKYNSKGQRNKAFPAPNDPVGF